MSNYACRMPGLPASRSCTSSRSTACVMRSTRAFWAARNEMKAQIIRIGVARAALATLIAMLSGCVPLVIGAGVAAGAAVATDRRTTGTQLDDEVIEDKNALAINERFKGGDVHVNVTSYNG